MRPETRSPGAGGNQRTGAIGGRLDSPAYTKPSRHEQRGRPGLAFMASPRARRLVAQVHRLGPRALQGLVEDLIDLHPEIAPTIADRLTEFARLSPDWLAVIAPTPIDAPRLIGIERSAA